MPKILTGRHAELVGTTLVEPGQTIPADADRELVKRLEDEGLITNVKTAAKAAQEDS